MNNELNSSNSDNHLSEITARIAEAQNGFSKIAQPIDISAFSKSFGHTSTLASFNQEYISAFAEKMNFFVPDERLSEVALRLNETMLGFSKMSESFNISGLASIYSSASAFAEKMNFFVPDERLSEVALRLNEAMLGFSKMSESFNVSGLASIYSSASAFAEKMNFFVPDERLSEVTLRLNETMLGFSKMSESFNVSRLTSIYSDALAPQMSLFLPPYKASEQILKMTDSQDQLLKILNSANRPVIDIPALNSSDSKPATPVPQRHKKSKHENKKTKKQSNPMKYKAEVVPEILGEGEIAGFNPTVEIDGKLFKTHTKHSFKLILRLWDDPMQRHLN